jgi:ankyrin repeat protein
LANEGKLILMFDGLDEVNDYKDKVIQLIDALINLNKLKKILLTTRNHFKIEIEDHFRTFSFNLNNFDYEEQKYFLCKYWRNLKWKQNERPSSGKLMKSAEDLLAQIKSSLTENITQLIGIPLQTKMLADVYFQRINEQASAIKITNIADLYSEFIETKIKIRFEEKNQRDPTREKKQAFKREKKHFYSKHSELSLSILFDAKSVENEHDEPHNDLELSEEEILEYGVIVAFTLDKTPTFLHQSFAEYFLAKKALQNIQENKECDAKELEVILKDKRHFLVRKFLNSLLETNRVKRRYQGKENDRNDFKHEIENCCRENLKFLLKYLIEQRQANFKKENSDYITMASREGHKDIVAFLIEKGVDVNQKNQLQETGNGGKNALLEASEYGHIEIVRMLLQYENINVNALDQFGNTPLMLASMKDRREVVRVLLQHENINVNQKDAKVGLCAIECASMSNNIEIVKMLLKNENIDVNQQDNIGSTALMWTSFHGYKECVQMLLQHRGIKVNQKDKFGSTALMWACKSKYGNKECVKMLLQHKDINVNQRDKSGRSTFRLAYNRGDEEIVQMLLEHIGFDENQKNHLQEIRNGGKNGALLEASDSDHLENENKDADDFYNQLLLFASIIGNKEKIEISLQQENIDVNQRDANGCTPLMIASRDGHKEIVRMLLKHKSIDANLQNKKGLTALVEASRRGHNEIVKLLSDHNANKHDNKLRTNDRGCFL